MPLRIGLAPDLPSNEAAIEVILAAIEQAGFKPGVDLALDLDVASSEFHKNGRCELASESRQFDAAQFADFLGGWVDAYPIVTIEDGMAEDDWDGWQLLTAKLGSKVQLVGDDLFVTNTEILQQGIARGGQLDPHQAEPDRHADGDARGHRHGRQGRVFGGRFASLRRDGGHHHRRPQRVHSGEADQDRGALPFRPNGQVQPIAPH